MNPEIRMHAHIQRRDRIAGAPERVKGHVLAARDVLPGECWAFLDHRTLAEAWADCFAVPLEQIVEAPQ